MNQTNPTPPSQARQILDSLHEGDISRRNAILSLLGMGFSATAVISLLPTAVANAQDATASAERSGGRLVVGMSTSPSSLDPAFGINSPEFSITSWIYDNLVELTPELELRPMLATDWESNPEATEWTFNLRTDATFSNGRPVVADDVVFSVTRILNPDTGSPGQSGLGPIESVEAVDDHTVVFLLTSPYADFPLELTQRWGRIIAHEAADNLATQPIGSGPFILSEYVPGSHVVLSHNPDHWNPNAGLVDQIELRTFPDEVAQITALQNGDLHIMYDLPPVAYDDLSGTEDVVIQEIPTGTWIPLIMRVDTPPFDNPLVREAIKYSMDRQTFVDAILFGHGTRANDHNVPPNHPFAWDVEPRERDVDKAKELLAEAGYPDGIEFDLVAATDRAIRAETAVVIQSLAADAGIKFNVQTIDYDTFIAQVYKQGPLYIGNWGMRPTLDSQLVSFFTTDASLNEYAYSNPELDEKLMEARAELNEDVRGQLYREAQEILSTEGPVMIGYFLNFIGASRKEVSGYQPHPLSYFDLRYVSLSE